MTPKTKQNKKHEIYVDTKFIKEARQTGFIEGRLAQRQDDLKEELELLNFIKSNISFPHGSLIGFKINDRISKLREELR